MGKKVCGGKWGNTSAVSWLWWLALAGSLTAQTADNFEQRFQAIMKRPAFQHARFGVEFYSLEEGKVIYAWNPQELFIPGSTTKVLSVGTALEVLGPEFRFHTKIYRTGPVKHGTLDGNLVLAASGDPDLSNRIQPDGTMTFENEDHSYDGYAAAKAVAGDPLAVIKALAAQVRGSGIQRVKGHVLVDVSLFAEGERELGTGVVMSPIVVNDNLVDITVTPGAQVGDAATLTVSPQTRYLTIQNEVKTGAAGSKLNADWGKDTEAGDGTHSVVLTGTIAMDAKPKLRVYRVPSPSHFAETVLREALAAAGVRVTRHGKAQIPEAASYRPETVVAEHVSPALGEDAKVTLKVSQNLHASLLPFLVGVYGDKGTKDARQSGFDLERKLLEKAKLDVTGAVQNDGAGGAAMFTPDFMVSFLRHVNEQPFGAAFKKDLPVLGKDGTLAEIQVHSPAAGHVFAKTGTFGSGNALTRGGLISGKGLAGFIDTQDGQHLIFAAYINFVPLKDLEEERIKMVGETVGEIAAAAYDGFAGRK